ncbi:uncharacterized protein TRAVEDRAFT_54298 [Trametes versicolor FP-101664 SS1]|uniref:Uncharacterized protein n=1 Tax=Trametes versicolor (strain FP-101664) TaxID=717944 RepID=R7S780_TRAVS|nr:uncharacterized protein TRAVEDRAFT_54298 [Trametes versicolor FP-101664 SS1]EIW51878.1 hypothetical protein TRAVEDRAFT_54298 [Trametes versicolor FP-101664 SS1]
MELLETSIKALEIANLAADKIPIPGLSTAVSCALSIAKKAKDIKDTRDDCRALAKRAADFVLAVYQQLKNGSSDTGLKEYVTMFLRNLQDIESLMDRRLRPRMRDRIRFVLSRDEIADQVEVLTTRLNDSFGIFMMRAALTIDDSMNTLTSGNLRLMQHIDDSARVGDAVLGETRVIRTDISDLAHRVGGNVTFDGDLRLFARENIALLEPIVDSHKPWDTTITQRRDENTLVQANSWPRTGRVSRHRGVVKAAGDLTGTKVVVHVYPDQDDLLFIEALKFARRIFHSNILSVMGYSRPGGLGQAAYIVTEGRDFDQRLSMVKWLDIPESDLDEMCIEFELGTGGGQTRWKRYQSSCIPVNTTLLIWQRVCVLDGFDAASRMMRALPDLSVLQGQYRYIGIARYRVYFTETTITMSVHATEQVYPPLWFFLLQFDGNNGSAHDCNIPTGFWSSEKYPTSVPAGIIFDSTPQFEPIEEGVGAPLFTSTQVLGDLVFTTRTKMATDVLQLGEDELLAYREVQESHYTTSDAHASNSDDSGGDSVATDDSDEDDAEDSDAESLASGSRNNDHVLAVCF